MDQLDAITLLYLSKKWDGEGSLQDFAHTFQQTRTELTKLLKQEHDGLNKAVEGGTYGM